MADYPWTSGVKLLFHNAPGEDDPTGFPRGTIEFAKAVRYVVKEAPAELMPRFAIHYDYGTLGGSAHRGGRQFAELPLSNRVLICGSQVGGGALRLAAHRRRTDAAMVASRNLSLTIPIW